MAKDKPRQSLADYVTIALSPLLIMALVGSLVFFLLEILYVGQYSERLQWTLFFFIFAKVLIARISIEQGNEKAGLYGLALGAVVFLALLRYVEYPEGSLGASFGWLINLGLMAIIWWCAHRLTWDCTYIDDKVDASGKGVLEAAGLDAEVEQPAQSGDEPALKNKSPALLAWWDRYHRYREAQRRKPHTPGVWVVYFSLAALPIFGLGQSLIPVEESARRQHAFWLMVYYAASGLGLLLTTCFLGLRRYLRQRKLKMPAAMTATWLVLGGGLIAVLMLLGALLPRPYGEYQLLKFTPLGSQELDSSRYALKSDGAGKGEGQASSEMAKKDQQAQSGSGTKPDEEGGPGQKSDKAGGGKSGKKQGSGQQQGKGGEKADGGSSKDSNTSRDDSRSEEKQKKQEEEQKDDKEDAQQKQQQQANQQQTKKSDRSGGPSASEQTRKKSARTPSGGRMNSPSTAISRFFSKFSGLATFLKWLVFGVLALVVIFFILRSGLKFLANFTDWAKRLLAAIQAWWAGLFGGAKEKTAAELESEAGPQGSRRRPFASFRNPFEDGTADQLPPEEVVRYSFDALQSWAGERGLDRAPQETPLEFAERLIAEYPALEVEGRGLAGLYARAAYARGRLNPGCLGTVKQFWSRLEAVSERPLSV
ncbi:MAG TPA: DUF4129 domain-containing protein [Gemmataceae bacterium]|nr:DUF4129 domain-containing protein [Gemmataceae bacterium]